MMHHVVISMGSNTRCEENIALATGALQQLLEKTRFTSVLQTEDVRGTGRSYLNRLCSGQTRLSAAALTLRLKQIEARQGRKPGEVTIDLDLLQYDTCRMHLSDWSRPYVSGLIDELDF